MIRSMTAYGRSCLDLASGKWEIEIHSVNRKMLDVNISLPREMLFLDLDIRQLLAEEVARGQLSVRVNFEPPKSGKRNLSRLKALKKEWTQVAEELGLEAKKEITLDFLLQLVEKTESGSEEKELKRELYQALKEALTPFIAMRKKEGEALFQDFRTRIKEISQALKKIEQLVPLFKKQYCQKLKERVLELVAHLNEERVFQEAALFVEKSDVSEEIVRLYSHLEQFEDVLKSKKRAVGKSLDFLAQEMGREINTLNAKAGDSEIAKLAIFIKGEVEKIREQVQNVE